MNIEKKLFSIMVVMTLLGLGITFSGCVEEEDENKITVGTSADFAPFEYIDENGDIVGFDIELITTILENLNYTVEVKDIGWDPLIPSIKSGNIDVIAAAMTITDEREEQIDFSDPYYEADQSILIKTDVGVEINMSDDLDNFTQSISNLTIGAQIGTTGADWIQTNLIDVGLMEEDQLQLYDLYIDAVADLDIGRTRLDAVILDSPVGEAFAENTGREVAYIIITDENYGFGVKEGNTDLLDEINAELENFMNSEDWNDLITKYFG
jgi:polar amino acid transport system substrate-binding protein